MGQKFIGIDLGTTFLKGAVIDLDTVSLGATKRVLFPSFLTGKPGRHREVDTMSIVNAVLELIGFLLDDCEDISGIVFCTQMHGLVLCDEHGTPYSNAITWQDQRMLDMVDNSGVSLFDQMIVHVTEQDKLFLGNDLLEGRPIGFLYWQKFYEAKPQFTPTLYPCSLPDFIIAHLCHVKPCTDATNAAAHGAYNLVSRSWHTDLIQRLDLTEYAWPRIVPHGTVTGVLDIAGKKIPCYVPVGDHQCALLGSLLRDDELSINVSTGSQVGILSSRPETSLLHQTRPYFDNQYLKAVIHIPAGRALAALVRLTTELAEAQGIAIPDPWEYIDRVTRSRTTTDLRVNLAFFASSCGDRGAIENMREENMTISSLFTAAFDSMALNYVNCVRRITEEQCWQRIVFAGGLVQKMNGLRSAILRNFNTEFRVAPTSEDTLFGLGVLALVCSGRATSMHAALDMAQNSLVASPR